MCLNRAEALKCTFELIVDRYYTVYFTDVNVLRTALPNCSDSFDSSQNCYFYNKKARVQNVLAMGSISNVILKTKKPKIPISALLYVFFV